MIGMTSEGLVEECRKPARGLFASDLDGTLVGDPVALERLNGELDRARQRLTLVYVTGRSLPSTLGLIAETGLLQPDLIVAGVGSAIYRGPDWTPDLRWQKRIARGWSAERVRGIASFFPALMPQPEPDQSPLKCSYTLAERDAVEVLPRLQSALKLHGLKARIIYSSGRDLDILPHAAGKGNAVSYLARDLGLPLTAVVTCGDSGNDREMLALGCPAVVVGNAQPELSELSGAYRAKAFYAAGVHEGLLHYGWL